MMTDRIKLTEEDMWVGIDVSPQFIHLAIRPTLEFYKANIDEKKVIELKSQILEDHEKVNSLRFCKTCKGHQNKFGFVTIKDECLACIYETQNKQLTDKNIKLTKALAEEIHYNFVEIDKTYLALLQEMEKRFPEKIAEIKTLKQFSEGLNLACDNHRAHIMNQNEKIKTLQNSLADEIASNFSQASLRQKIEEELDIYKSQKINITKNFKGVEIKNKHAYCIYVPRDDLWVADEYQNLMNLNKLQYSEQSLKQKLEKIEKYKEAIHEAKNKAKSPLEHHALESAEHTIKKILEDNI